MFLAVALLGCLVVAWILYKDAKRLEALVALAAAAYFAMRLLGLGRRKDA